MLGKLFANATVAHAHCDLYCGVYDPAQAKIEALSVVKTHRNITTATTMSSGRAASRSKRSAPKRPSIT